MVNYIGIGGPGQIGGIRKNQQTTESQKTNEAKGVQFQSTLQEAQAAGEASSTQDVERAVKIAELKAQVAQGSYEPDMQKVSSSLLQFLVEGK
mgnify:CR=1 FL=1